MKKSLLSSMLCLLVPFYSFSQDIRLLRVEPPFWWVGFKNPELQLLVYGKNIGKTNPSIYYPGVELRRAHLMQNPDYLFLDITITGEAQPGSFPVSFSLDGKVVAEYFYEIKSREKGSPERKGFNSSDVIYLLVPDRFANGDTTNDNRPLMREYADRSNKDGRHGGDIRGIVDHLDYLKDMGFTAIWCTPLLENNMIKYSYHGYSTTDYYRIDPRFGNNEDYVSLADSLHKKGMKLIMDMVFNHCGSSHWWMANLPTKDWLHQFPEFTRTSYRGGTMTDPYVSNYDSIKFLKGWFDQTMPDLNQHNPYLAKYLIQNSIWWIEFAHLDGIRQDTHPYPYKDFMSEWGKTILEEYPGFNIVGECWLTNPGSIAYWQKDALNRDGYNSNLPSVFDFAMYDALRLGFMEPDGWNSGIFRMYEILSQDFHYPDPSNIVVFADNHDVDRYLASQQNDTRKFRMALAFVLTIRGIPEIFYGSEVLLSTGEEKGHGLLRKDFPGGWAGDQVNGFTGTGLTPGQQDMQQYVKTLLNWRKSKEVIHTGKLKHFIPEDGVYVYFRYNDKETVMVALNNHEKETKILEYKRYDEFLREFSTGYDILNRKVITDLSKIEIAPKSALILELKR